MQKHTATAAFTTLLSLAFTALLGCDAPSDTPSFRGLPGGYWTDGDDGCEGKYLKTESGAMCLPPWGDPACNVPQVDMCGHQVGGKPIGVGTNCTYWCADDSECLSGQRCDPESSQCVWQNEPTPYITAVTPGIWGSCTSGDLDTCPAVAQCESSNFGSFCSPMCADDADCAYAPLNECSEEAPAVCDQGICKIPCDGNGGCWGVNGLFCNPNKQQCVWN
jgi:hypothetical protein